MDEEKQKKDAEERLDDILELGAVEAGAAGANQLQAGGACHVAALANGNSLQTERTCVGVGKLHLIGGTEGAKDGNGELTLGANQLYALVASELAGLGKILFVVQNSIGTEQGGEGLCGHVNVTCGSFDNEFLCHFSHL